ncbi:hypothetical protein ACFLY6_01770 [Candidatus Dependentiae bacterium]
MKKLKCVALALLAINSCFATSLEESGREDSLTMFLVLEDAVFESDSNDIFTSFFNKLGKSEWRFPGYLEIVHDQMSIYIKFSFGDHLMSIHPLNAFVEVNLTEKNSTWRDISSENISRARKLAAENIKKYKKTIENENFPKERMEYIHKLLKGECKLEGYVDIKKNKINFLFHDFMFEFDRTNHNLFCFVSQEQKILLAELSKDQSNEIINCAREKIGKRGRRSCIIF